MIIKFSDFFEIKKIKAAGMWNKNIKLKKSFRNLLKQFFSRFCRTGCAAALFSKELALKSLLF